MRYLIIKLGAIGDIVTTLPAISAIRSDDTEANITWVCGIPAASILETIPGIDEIIKVDETRLFRGSRLGRVAELLRVMARLAGRRYDRIFTFYRDRRYQLLSALTFGPTRSFADDSHRPVAGRSRSWESVRFCLDLPQRLLPCPVLPAVQWSINPLPNELSAWRKDKPIVIVPGGAKNILRDDALRRWPIERYRAVAEALIEQGYRVAIVGAPSDRWVQPYFEKLEVIDLVGMTSLPELLGLMQISALVITHDTGTAHLARLANAPGITIFGPTNPEEVFGPIMWGDVPAEPRSVALWGGANLSCRPCYDGRNYALCDDNLCMQGTPVNEVIQAAKKILTDWEKKDTTETGNGEG